MYYSFRLRRYHKTAILEKKIEKSAKKFLRLKKCPYLCTAFRKQGRLAQLVQSICLTSRGSAVRIRQRPRKGQANIGSLDFFYISISFVVIIDCYEVFFKSIALYYFIIYVKKCIFVCILMRNLLILHRY